MPAILSTVCRTPESVIVLLEFIDIVYSYMSRRISCRMQMRIIHSDVQEERYLSRYNSTKRNNLMKKYCECKNRHFLIGIANVSPVRFFVALNTLLIPNIRENSFLSGNMFPT